MNAPSGIGWSLLLQEGDNLDSGLFIQVPTSQSSLPVHKSKSRGAQLKLKTAQDNTPVGSWIWFTEMCLRCCFVSFSTLENSIVLYRNPRVLFSNLRIPTSFNMQLFIYRINSHTSTHTFLSWLLSCICLHLYPSSASINKIVTFCPHN